MLWFVLSLLLAAPADDETKEKVQKLITELKNEKSPLAWTAAQDLGALGAEAKEAIPALREALNAKSVETRCHAAAALLLIDPGQAERAFPVLRDVFKDPKQTLVHMTLLDPLGQKLEPATK